ncbi:MAG: hypothetical protein AAB089_08275 [Nitrospirota bacterium]
MKTLCAFFLMALFVFSTVPGQAAPLKSGEIRENNRLLESELKLAKNPQLYFIFNLKEKKIYFKCRGVTLRELEIEKVNLWGPYPDLKYYALLKRSTLFKPERKEINPKDNEKDKEEENFELEALELDDMPANFSMVLDKGINISVRQKPEGFFSELRSIYSNTMWHITRPLITAWNAVQGKPFTSVYITLSKKDAQSLYWSFYEGLVSIIYYPKG